MSGACRRYQSDMAELSDQVRLLYRDHSNSSAAWQKKHDATAKQVCEAVVGCWLVCSFQDAAVGGMGNCVHVVTKYCGCVLTSYTYAFLAAQEG